MSPTGKDRWSKRTIDMILLNKKYCGYSVVKVENKSYEQDKHHEPIIPLELFEKVQAEKAKCTNVEMGENGKLHRKSTKYSSK